MTIYSVFLLNEPETSAVRYVGCTSQLPSKRLSDLMAAARFGSTSFLSTWLLELLSKEQQPHLTIVLETKDKDEANDSYIETFNQYVGSGLLLNSMLSKKKEAALRTEPIVRKSMQGRPIQKASPSAKSAARKKEK